MNLTRCSQIRVGMLFDRDGAVWQVVSKPQTGDLIVRGQWIDPNFGIPTEYAMRNERDDKYYVVRTELDGERPVLMCFDLEFEPSKFNFRMPHTDAGAETLVKLGYIADKPSKPLK